MKKSYIFGLIAAIAGIALLISASKDITNYVGFAEASESGDIVKIVGQLAKDKEMQYNPTIDPNYFSFYVNDKQGLCKKVILKASKPQDFELSEQIVVTGKMEGNDFMASELLMKCPSKYKDEEVYVKSQN